MTYFEQLQDFRRTYRLSRIDNLKLTALYPIFKLHFWLHCGIPTKQRLAQRIFDFLPKKKCLRINLNMPALPKTLAIFVWLRPDRLSSFIEVFWVRNYLLKSNWKPNIFIDAGANAGYASFYVAGQCAPRNILAIEANPEFKEILEATAQVLKEHGIEMHVAMGAVVGHPRELLFDLSENDRESRVASEAPAHQSLGRGLLVQGKTLRQWIDESGQDAKDKRILLKADIEGSEYEIFGNDPETIELLDYLVMEVHGPKEKRDPLVATISKAHRVIERLSDPSCADVEILFSEKRP